MKKYMVFVLLLILVSSPAAFCQKQDGAEMDPEHMFEMRHRELDLEEREMELNFQREMRKIELEERHFEIKRMRNKAHGKKKHCKHSHKKLFLILALCAVVNILMAVWVYRDIRNRNTGSGLWIVITLLAGFWGAIIYAIVRIGDKRQAQD